MVDLYGELVALIRSFEERGVDYALCGALALAVYGVPRATKDIDLLARAEDEGRLREAVRACGFTLEALPMSFRSGIRVKRFSKIIDARPVMVDILWAEDGLEEVWAGKRTLPWKEGSINVVSREGLVAMKLTAGRPQDLVDIQSLTESMDDEPS